MQMPVINQNTLLCSEPAYFELWLKTMVRKIRRACRKRKYKERELRRNDEEWRRGSYEEMNEDVEERELR